MSVQIKKQKGVSFWGFVWGSIFFISATVVAVKSIPPYLNNQKINRALLAMPEQRNIMQMSRGRMLRLMKRKLNIDSADTYVDLNKAFVVRQLKDRRNLSVNYEVAVHLFYNVYLLFDFKNEVDVTRNPVGSG